MSLLYLAFLTIFLVTMAAFLGHRLDLPGMIYQFERTRRVLVPSGSECINILVALEAVSVITLGIQFMDHVQQHPTLRAGALFESREAALMHAPCHHQ
jgi:hypothetical protein